MTDTELHARGWAEVIEERPCPKIAPGPGRVVTATITHANDDVRTLTMSSGEVLHVTGNHRMFSASQQDWVLVKDLRVGEELRTAKGRESVAALGYQRGRHQVYNLEVETEHCYFVGNGEVLTHNTCGPDGESLALTHSAKPPPNPYGSGGNPATQEMNANLAEFYANAGGEKHERGSGLPERGLRGSDGSIVRPDGQLGTAGKESKTFFNSVDANSRGGAAKREIKPAIKIIQNMPGGSIMHVVPKISKSRDASRKRRR